MDYSKYQVEDFVADTFFVKWVKSPTEEHVAFWSAFISKYPECSTRIEEARRIVLLLDIKEDVLPEEKFIELWEAINREERIPGPQIVKDAPMPSRKFSMAFFYKIAAVLIISAASVLIYRYYGNQEIMISTSYGESRALFLPDSSKVTLNSNSTIRYNPDEFSAGKREVFLNGEAFFSVVHQLDDRNFRVHTDELNVEVLGTKFNVNSRRGRTQIVLQEGKVKLDLNSKNEAPVFMKPGELVEFVEENETTSRKNVDATNYSAWRNNQLVFSRTSLKEIAQMLEDNYGYKVVFDDPEMAERNFTGTSSSENLEELFEKLQVVFGLDIEQESKTLTIHYKK